MVAFQLDRKGATLLALCKTWPNLEHFCVLQPPLSTQTYHMCTTVSSVGVTQGVHCKLKIIVINQLKLNGVGSMPASRRKTTITVPSLRPLHNMYVEWDSVSTLLALSAWTLGVYCHQCCTLCTYIFLYTSYICSMSPVITYTRYKLHASLLIGLSSNLFSMHLSQSYVSIAHLICTLTVQLELKVDSHCHPLR